MKRKINLVVIFIFLGQLLVAQNTIPTIKATSNIIRIRDGISYLKGYLQTNSALEPEIYITSIKNSKVTFYTNLDSISFNIQPNKYYDFNILLNEIDSTFVRIKYAQPFLETLKEAKEFNLLDNRQIPEFTYQEKDNPNLMALRKGFKLDSVAGTGNEVSKILNVLHWIHRIIPHDGNSENPQVLNAMSLLTVCKNDNRGLNCRGLATVLNECYLSLGIKSRFITCLPKDPNDTECHVINMVYSNDLKKWLWIDPTNDAYVMNEKGELLSIEEVRERLITDKPLILNPDANWNFESSTVKEEYLYNYMAKNLYRLECPINSEYDLETIQKGKEMTYLQLLPIDYPKQKPDKTENNNDKSGTTIIKYNTNNPEIFWKAPK